MEKRNAKKDIAAPVRAEKKRKNRKIEKSKKSEKIKKRRVTNADSNDTGFGRKNDM
jgi:hypothetical protein